MFSGQSMAQGEVQLSGEEKAYLYHVVMKSPTLKKNISKYFEYSGDSKFNRHD